MRWLATLLLVLPWAAPAGEAAAGDPAPRPSAQGAGPETRLAPPPYDIRRSWLLDVERSEESETILNERPIRYLGRGPAKTKLQVRIERQGGAHGEKGEGKAPAPYRLRVRVPVFHREAERGGQKESLSFDATLYDRRRAGRRVKVFRSNGQPAERLALERLTGRPWYRLEWDGRLWAKGENLAQGEAWPLADGLALERELPVLLPPLPRRAVAEGQRFELAVVLPYPAPLRPPLTAVVRYRVLNVTRGGGRRVATLAFHAALDETPAKGVSWGGIRVGGVRATATLSGRLEIDVLHKRLRKARFELDTLLRSIRGPESFLARWKLQGIWKRARR